MMFQKSLDDINVVDTLLTFMNIFFVGLFNVLT
jgi:hypothetical protein